MKAFAYCFLILSLVLIGCSDNGVSYHVEFAEDDSVEPNYDLEFTFFSDSTFIQVQRNATYFDSLFKSGKWTGELKEGGVLHLEPKASDADFYLKITNGKVKMMFD